MNKQITAIRKGELALAVLAIRDMPADKWLSQFKPHEVEWLTTTPEGMQTCSRSPTDREKVLEVLSGNLPEKVSQSDSGELQSASFIVKGGVHGVPFNVQQIITTDKGEFYALQPMMVRLKPLYAVENFERIFYDSLLAIDVSPDVEYISAQNKARLVKKIKVVIKEYVLKELDKVGEE